MTSPQPGNLWHSTLLHIYSRPPCPANLIMGNDQFEKGGMRGIFLKLLAQAQRFKISPRPLPSTALRATFFKDGNRRRQTRSGQRRKVNEDGYVKVDGRSLTLSGREQT